VQLRNAFGEDDKDWWEKKGNKTKKKMISQVRGDEVYRLDHEAVWFLRVRAQVPRSPQDHPYAFPPLSFSSLVHLGMMWRTMSDNPQIMPLNWLSNTIACPSGATGCVNGALRFLRSPLSNLFFSFFSK